MYFPLIAAAILPSLILVGYICFRDRNSPEPARQLLKAFFFGMLSTGLSLCFSTPATYAGLVPTDPSTVGQHCAVAFFGAGIPEELAKLIMLWLVLRRNKYYDEGFDGIVYAVCIGMGFAFVENIGYLAQAGQYWLHAGITRGLISVPGHYAFAVLMGFHYSCAHFGFGYRHFHRIMTFVAPMLAHGLFDWVLMVSDAASYPGISTILTIVFLAFFIWLQRLCQRRVLKLAGK